MQAGQPLPTAHLRHVPPDAVPSGGAGLANLAGGGVRPTSVLAGTHVPPHAASRRLPHAHVQYSQRGEDAIAPQLLPSAPSRAGVRAMRGAGGGPHGRVGVRAVLQLRSALAPGARVHATTGAGTGRGLDSGEHRSGSTGGVRLASSSRRGLTGLAGVSTRPAVCPTRGCHQLQSLQFSPPSRSCDDRARISLPLTAQVWLLAASWLCPLCFLHGRLLHPRFTCEPLGARPSRSAGRTRLPRTWRHTPTPPPGSRLWRITPSWMMLVAAAPTQPAPPTNSAPPARPDGERQRETWWKRPRLQATPMRPGGAIVTLTLRGGGCQVERPRVRCGGDARGAVEMTRVVSISLQS